MIDSEYEKALIHLQKLSNDHNVDIFFDDAFEGTFREGLATVVHNPSNGQFGVIATKVVEWSEEAVCFFVFNGKLFDYAKAEGFDRSQMLTAFENKVFKKVDPNQFADFIFDTSV